MLSIVIECCDLYLIGGYVYLRIEISNKENHRNNILVTESSINLLWRIQRAFIFRLSLTTYKNNPACRLIVALLLSGNAQGPTRPTALDPPLSIRIQRKLTKRRTTFFAASLVSWIARFGRSCCDHKAPTFPTVHSTRTFAFATFSCSERKSAWLDSLAVFYIYKITLWLAMAYTECRLRGTESLRTLILAHLAALSCLRELLFTLRFFWVEKRSC